MRDRIMLLLIVSCLSFTPVFVQAQSYAFGFKGGLAAGLQRINGLNNRDILFGYQGDVFIESADEDQKYSLYACLGYHQRGSTQIFRNGYNPFSRRQFGSTSIPTTFNNISLGAGGKQRFDLGWGKTYYSLGLRAEYTATWDLGFLNHIDNQEQFVNRFLWGVSVGGGLEFPFSELVAGIVELHIHPDLSRQMFLPQQAGFDQNGNAFRLQEQDIRNVTVEISLGMRFLHKIEYID